MSKRKRRPARKQLPRRRATGFKKPETILFGSHQIPKSWRPFDWFVPFIDDHACIHHGHGLDDDDHSRCGPVLFCCGKALARYLHLFPQSDEAQAEWRLTPADHIAGWLDKGVAVLYFVFCDPQRPEGLWAIGLAEEPLRQTLYQQLPLESHLDQANPLA